MRIKKGDNVIVVAGKDRGKTGKVVRALPRESMVVVEGLNQKTRHLKTNKQTKQGGGIVKVSAPLHVSNVMLVDPKSGKPTRVGKTLDQKGKLVRIAKKSGTKLS